jgi:DNA replication protein DnaC
MSNYVKMMNNVESLHLDSWKGRIDAVIDAINSGSMDVVDGLYSLTDAEVSERQKRVDVAMVKVSHFPFQKTFADYDFSFQPQLKKEEITDLGNLRFVEARENVVFLGTPGTGKTHLSVAIGIEAAKSRYRTYFATCNDLIADLKRAQSENTLTKRLKFYYSYSLLIIDEVGFLPIDRKDSDLLFQLISMRYEKRSTIFTSNKSFNHWGEVFGDMALANAMIDRILHHCKVIQIVGPSYRMKGKEDLFKED